MKAHLVLTLFMALHLCDVFGHGIADSTRHNDQQKRQKLITLHYLKGTTQLYLDPPGPRINRTVVLGSHRLEESAFRFIPLTTAPERLPQKNFEKHFWYNSLIKELSIPYHDIASVRTRGLLIITTTQGKKYKIYMKGYRAVAEELRKKIGLR